MTLVSSAVGCRTYSSAPLSRINCTVKEPCSPRPCSVHEICTSVTWRTLIVCSVCCSATYAPFFRVVGNRVRCFLPAEDAFKPAGPEKRRCGRSGLHGMWSRWVRLSFLSCARGVASLGEVLLVEAHRVPDGVFGLLRIGEVAHVHLLALQHLVVLEEAPELRQPVLRQLAVVFVGAVLRVVEVDADYLLVALAFVDHVHHPDRAGPQEAKWLDRFLHQDEHVERVVVLPQSPRDEAVVGRVDHGRVQDTVDLQQPRLLVQLVLDPGAFGDLDQGRKLLRCFVPDRDLVPGMGHLGCSFRRMRSQGAQNARDYTLGPRCWRQDAYRRKPRRISSLASSLGINTCSPPGREVG